ncbi:GntR family transcriptional regulator [Paeniglutamicibacter cryotolerans]|uniref:DNA-binding GntR family transcriptional regulator n=1 Tax=Paeniglutamicibacter cryotolerans TaxID=670079 RepID=A0A839QP67_9MICC|nr:GntR family transcriptional regulator [Paeniglutamicibacter cryotolerans]MBB2996435.1 DNA-binding GntR family transcriptional regulator [Paeniglutamicibacter cryotolerans]
MTPSKSEAAYSLLHGRISNGEFSPGYRLVLGTIANELGCSTVPVREAIRRLEAEGLVNFERNVGATVAKADATLYLHTMQTLAVIEGAATALAAPLLGPADIAEARAFNAQLCESLADFDPRRFTELNNRFHEALYGPCPNPHILDLVHRGWNRLNAMRASSFTHIPGRAAVSVAEHEALLDLIASGASPALIEQAARAHRTGTLNAYLAATGLPPSTL